MCIENEKTKKVYSFISFLLGLSISEGISAFLTVRNTSFVISQIFAPLLFVYLLLAQRKQLSKMIVNIPIGFKIFFAIIIFSIIPGFFYIDAHDLVRGYTTGLIYFFIVFSMAMDVYILRTYRSSIIQGVFFGYFINIAFSLVCFLAYKEGHIITLSTLINRSAFYVPARNFRSQGFFLEPSHFIRYIVSIVLLLISTIKIKQSFVRLFLFIASAIVIFLSYSGSVVILMVGIAMYIVLINKTKKKGIGIINIMIIILVAISIILLKFVDNFQGFYIMIKEGLSRIFTGAKITDISNEYRFQSMKLIIDYIINNRIYFGCGWNMTGTMIKSAGINTISSFSTILEIIFETGLLGGIVYIVSLISLAVNLLKNRTEYSIALALSLMMILALQIGTDCAFSTTSMLIFGISIAELADRKDNKDLEKKNDF